MLTIDQKAQVVHDLTRSLQTVLGETPAEAWADTTEDNREFSRSSVREAEAGQTPRQAHETWMRDKIAAGWTYGPVRDNDAKIHPLLVDYDDVPPLQRLKDAAIVAVVEALSGDRVG